MEKLPRQSYTTEFRRQAVEMVTREDLSIAEASRRLSLSPKTLTNWVRRASGTCRPRLTRNSSRGSNGRRERQTWRPFLTTHLTRAEEASHGLHRYRPAQ